MAFGHYIRRQREGRDMTLTELARRVEISIAYLSRIEHTKLIWPRAEGTHAPSL